MNEDSTIDRETWKPTPAEMEAYLNRELELAGSNLRVLLATFRDSKTLKEIKDCVLHTSETLETALAAEVKAGRIKVCQGRFSLA